MSRGNRVLGGAKTNTNDEHYTSRIAIETELGNYRSQFSEKSVLCNCDDPYESEFFKYFAMNFNSLGLKRLAATSYRGSKVTGIELRLFEIEGTAYKIELKSTGEIHSLNDLKPLVTKNVKKLAGDGDFRSEECVQLLKKSDIVVTNPPFSLFREYIALLGEHDKKFLIIAPDTALHYQEVFRLIQSNKLRRGYSHPKEFLTPDGSVKKFGNIGWLTNLDTAKSHEKLQLFRKYNSRCYPTYDNLNAIHVDKTADIPCDYFGMMGVPDAFLDKFNPDQFELVGIPTGDMGKEIGVTKNYRGRTDISITKDGVTKCPYSRIIIRRKM